jgi:hypothetical protein
MVEPTELDENTTKFVNSFVPLLVQSIKGDIAQELAVIAAEQEAGSELVKAAENRFLIGILTGVAGVVGMTLLAWHGYGLISSERFINGDTLVLYKLGAQALLGAAIAYFCYTLIKIAERMFVPAALLRNDRTELVRTLLGVKAPTTAASETIKEVAGLVQSIKDIPKS